MSTRRKRSKRLLVTVLFAGVLASAAYAFTASNTVDSSQAGHGAQSISGYSATGVQYGLNATTPSNIDSVSFTLNPTTAATVKVQLVTSGSWYNCNNVAGAVTCATTSPQATVSAANNLTVLAVQ
jgi:hypothetical protein